MVEVNEGENNPQFPPQLEKNSQQANRICTAGNREADTISGVEQFVLTDVGKD
jgi:hypothetical protein